MGLNVFSWLLKRFQVEPTPPQVDTSGSIKAVPHSRPGQLPVGTIVIGCSNEWVPMVIGQITGYDDRFGTIPFIADCIRGKELMCFSALTVYSDEAFSRLVLMNPYERFNHVASHIEIELDKPKRGEDLSVAEYLFRVGVYLASINKQPSHETLSM